MKWPVVVVWNGRGLEAHTGVPAAVCRQVAALASKGWWDGLLIVGLAAAMMTVNFLFWWKFVGWILSEVVEGPIWLGQLLCIVPPALVVGFLLMTIYTLRFNR